MMWEYVILDTSTWTEYASHVVAELDQLGTVGWEICGCVLLRDAVIRYTLKRQKESNLGLFSVRE